MRKIKPIWMYTIFMFIMSMVVIMSWDDFFWGGTQGAQQLANHFEGYNGRYLGNIIIILMTRSILFRVIVYTVTNVGLAMIISKLLSNKVKMPYVLLILLTLPIGVFRQTYGWFSGFANYNVSALLVLLIFYLVYKSKINWLVSIAVLLLSFCSQFFAENISMVNIILSIAITFISLFNNRKRLLATVPWVIGSISGFFVMFQNSAYHSETSRGVSNIHISQFYRHILQDWLELFVKDSIVLIFLFAIVTYFILNRPKVIGNYLIFFTVYFVVRKYLNVTYNIQPLYLLVIELGLIIIFFGILIYTGITKLADEDKELYFIFLFSSIMMIAPFVVVTPFGPRNILLSYLMLSICLGILWYDLDATLQVETIDRLDMFVKKITASLAIVCLILYSINCFENSRRIALIKEAEAKNQRVVEVRKLPFSFLSQLVDGIGEGNREKEFKDYYHLSEDIDIKVVDRRLPLPWIQTNN